MGLRCDFYTSKNVEVLFVGDLCKGSLVGSRVLYHYTGLCHDGVNTTGVGGHGDYRGVCCWEAT